MKKNVSKFGCQLAITLLLKDLDIDELNDELFALLPENSNGPTIRKEDTRMAIVRIIDNIKDEANKLLDGVTEPVDIPVTPEPPEVVEEYNSKESFNLRKLSGNNKRFCWLPRTGSYYGGKVKFVFPQTGEEWVISNAAVTHGKDGNSRNHNQMFYFCGTDFKPGQKEYNNGRASIFSSPNSRATIVDIYYNK